MNTASTITSIKTGQETPARHDVNHVAFIMDGNGRWAKKRGLERHFGHQEGFKRVKEIAFACRELGIKCMSLYAFSTENWSRPQEEIDFLFTYLNRFLKAETKTLIDEDCRLHVSGDITRLPVSSQKAIAKALAATEHCAKYILNVCLNYGGRQEILKATKEIAGEVAAGTIKFDDITTATIESHLYTSGLPPIDLLIRTSGEQRLSNFMMYQLSYSEFIFTPTYWPDFTKERLVECLDEFKKRHRRYGGL